MPIPENYLAAVRVEGADGHDLPMTPQLMSEVIRFVETFRAERNGALPALQHLLDGDYDGRVVEFPWSFQGDSTPR